MRGRVFTLAALAVASITLSSAGYAHAGDDDDDHSSGSSPSRTTSSVEMWPPTTVQWPPLAPANTSGPDTPPVIPVP